MTAICSTTLPGCVSSVVDLVAVHADGCRVHFRTGRYARVRETASMRILLLDGHLRSWIGMFFTKLQFRQAAVRCLIHGSLAVCFAEAFTRCLGKEQLGLEKCFVIKSGILDFKL